MKNIINKGLALLVCGILAVATVFPAYAETNPEDNAYRHFSDSTIDREKNAAFFKQPTDRAGYYNGDAVYEYQIPEDSIIVSGDLGPYVYGKPVFALIDDYNYFVFHNMIVYNLPPDPDSDIVACFSHEYVYPDLYGYFDFAGTSLKGLGSPTDYQTHITGVDMSDCAKLRSLDFCGQPLCTELKVVNCPMLSSIKAKNCDYKLIEIQPKGFDAPASVRTFGSGELDLTYDAVISYGTAKAYAIRSDCDFYGWYVNGKLVETSKTLELTSGINAVACFVGDADGNGVVDLSDSLTALRNSLGVSDIEYDSADIDNDGMISIGDALGILRFTMGL